MILNTNIFIAGFSDVFKIVKGASIKENIYTYEKYEHFLSMKYYLQIFMVHVTKTTTLSGVGHV